MKTQIAEIFREIRTSHFRNTPIH